MLAVILSWGIIGIPTLLIGYGIAHGLERMSKMKISSLGGLDVYIAMGLCFLTVYAGAFSIFYKVGILACFVLCFITAFFIILDIKCGLFLWLRKWRNIKVGYIMPVVVFWIVFATVYYTSSVPEHYDTALYHAQAIRWVEEYGVVKGLGNLHFRFAYNSAFIPLQALFSLKWLVNQSLHTVNGFAACVMLIYAICTNGLLRKQTGKISDFIKFAVIIYIIENRTMLSSPSTDTVALLLVGYIFIKWMEFIENKEKNIEAWIYLSVLTVWGITLKLSVAPMILVAIYPLYLLIKDKKWRLMGISLLLGVAVLLPWMVRSVMISGYLVYPYSFIDIFQVDWKMPASVLNYDKKEIIVWGRGLKDVSLYELSVWEWLPTWLQSNSKFYNILFGGAIAALMVLVYMIVKSIKKNEWQKAIMCSVAIVSFVFWFFTAPLIRYGLIYSLILISLVWGFLYTEHKKALIKGAVFCLLLPFWVIYLDVFDADFVWKRQGDYEWRDNIEYQIEDVKVWVPKDGDQIGYAVFPSTPYKKIVSVVELRGDSLEDGFRIKEEWKDRITDGYGTTDPQ